MKKSLACLLVVGFAATGCVLGRAEMVKRSKTGGVLALKGMRDKAMEDAHAQMKANCPNGYEIVSEEMAKVGEETMGEAETTKEKKGSSTNTSSTTMDVNEYRITYECKSAG